MPKQIYEKLYRAVKQDMYQNYAKGDRYLQIREIATKFAASTQSVQKVIAKLKEEGAVTTRARQGITIENPSAPTSLQGKRIVVISNKQDGHFYEAFYEGVSSNVAKHGVKTSFMLNTYGDTTSLGFGHYLEGLEADGIVALSFGDSALPFYHLLTRGIDIVSDFIIDDLPTLPAIQTNNYLHAYEAGKEFLRRGCSHVVEIGFYPPGSKRYTGLKEALDEGGCMLSYFDLSSSKHMGMGAVSDAIRTADNHTGFFISDYAATYLFASLCIRIKKEPRNVFAYDAEDTYLQFEGLKPIKTVAPSFRELGKALSDMLLFKWEHGYYPSPIQQKL